jgi:ribosomal protein S3AE
MAKVMKKKFFEVDIPIVNEKYEGYAYTIDKLNNKIIKLDITRKLRGKNVDLILKIKVEDNKATAYPKKMILLPYYIKHMLHGGISYIEDSFKVETADGEVLIKPFLVTRKKVSRAVRKTLRNTAKNWLIDYLKTKTADDLFQEILSGQLQKPLSLKLKKVYPLAICEIRMFEVLKQEEIKREPKIVEVVVEPKEEVINKTEEVIESKEKAEEVKKEKPKKKKAKKEE